MWFVILFWVLLLGNLGLGQQIQDHEHGAVQKLAGRFRHYCSDDIAAHWDHQAMASSCRIYDNDHIWLSTRDHGIVLVEKRSEYELRLFLISDRSWPLQANTLGNADIEVFRNSNMVEVYRDFDWELDRFVEYRLPIKKPL
jgi:hypothetical protein